MAYIKRCATSLAIKEMQLKTATGYYYTPTKMATIKKIDNTMLTRMYRNQNPHTLPVVVKKI